MVLLFWVGLSGSKDIVSKKCAWLLLVKYYNKIGFVNSGELWI